MPAPQATSTTSWPAHLGTPCSDWYNQEIDSLIDAGDLEGMLKLSKAFKAAMVDYLLASNAGEAVGIVARTKNGRWVALLPEMSDPEDGPFRLQYFDARGFSGHSVMSSADKALQAMVTERFWIPDPGALDRLSGQQAWAEGTSRAGSWNVILT